MSSDGRHHGQRGRKFQFLGERRLPFGRFRANLGSIDGLMMGGDFPSCDILKGSGAP
ncbi:MAG: hypothetical protein HC871_03760 [Rhizobiales bacterium]|nr:hypothetical protein [Hyphomicrobiales bacterium]